MDDFFRRIANALGEDYHYHFVARILCLCEWRNIEVAIRSNQECPEEEKIEAEIIREFLKLGSHIKEMTERDVIAFAKHLNMHIKSYLKMNRVKLEYRVAEKERREWVLGGGLEREREQRQCDLEQRRIRREERDAQVIGELKRKWRFFESRIMPLTMLEEEMNHKYYYPRYGAADAISATAIGGVTVLNALKNSNRWNHELIYEAIDTCNQACEVTVVHEVNPTLVLTPSSKWKPGIVEEFLDTIERLNVTNLLFTHYGHWTKPPLPSREIETIIRTFLAREESSSIKEIRWDIDYRHYHRWWKFLYPLLIEFSGVGFPPRRSFVDTVMGYEESLKQRDEARRGQPPPITH